MTYKLYLNSNKKKGKYFNLLNVFTVEAIMSPQHYIYPLIYEIICNSLGALYLKSLLCPKKDKILKNH